MFEALLDVVYMPLASDDIDEFEAGIDFETFHTDDRVWSRWYKPSMDYVRGLQIAFEQCLTYSKELEWKLARTGSSFHKGSEEDLIDKYRQAVIDNAEKSARITELETTNTYLASVVQYYQQKENAKNAENLENVSRGTNNKFVSVDGISGKTKKKILFIVNESGNDVGRAAELLKIKSVGAYISEARKHFRSTDFFQDYDSFNEYAEEVQNPIDMPWDHEWTEWPGEKNRAMDFINDDFSLNEEALLQAIGGAA